MFCLDPRGRIAQHRHPVNHPSEYPDFGKNYCQCDNNFHPGWNIMGCCIPSKSNNRHIQAVDDNA